MKVFFDISGECYMRFILYSKMIMVHVDSQKYNVSSQIQVLADIQDQESDKYMFLYLCTFFLIPPPKKKDLR